MEAVLKLFEHIFGLVGESFLSDLFHFSIRQRAIHRILLFGD